MKTLLSNFYTYALWNLFLANNSARGVNQKLSLQDQLQEFWDANENAGVPEEELSGKTLENLYELATSDLQDAMDSVKSSI